MPKRTQRLAGPALLAMAVAFWAAPAPAQDPSSSECAGLADPTAEIACLRQALEASRKALAAAGAQAAAPPPAPLPPPAETRTALGNEQLPSSAAPEVRVERSEPDAIAATVSASRSDRRGLLVMLLDNGQIWRQDEATDLPVRIGEDERVRVEIAQSGFGGYRMRFPDLGRRIAVSRLR